jgi:transcriptional regulator with XRE-family HTH domain
MKFSEWFRLQLEERGLKPYHFAKLAGMRAGTVHNLLHDERGLGPEVARQIAAGLGLHEGVVFLAAGLMTDAPIIDGKDVDPQVMTGFRELEAMAPEDLPLAIEMMRSIRRRRTDRHPNPGTGTPGQKLRATTVAR